MTVNITSAKELSIHCMLDIIRDAALAESMLNTVDEDENKSHDTHMNVYSSEIWLKSELKKFLNERLRVLNNSTTDSSIGSKID